MSGRVDLVTSTVPSSFLEADGTILADIGKKTLKTGSYVVLVIREVKFSFLRKIFLEHSFKVCDHTNKVIYDSRKVPKPKNSDYDFPQRQDEICFIAKTNGSHPSKFVPDFATDNTIFSSRSPVSFAVAVNIQVCAHKLKEPRRNTPIFPDERSTGMFMHIIRLFCPSNGEVLGPFSDPLTVSLACLQTSRRCVSISHGGPGLKYAVGRIRVFATPKATMEKLPIYIDDEAPGVSVTTTDTQKLNECSDAVDTQRQVTRPTNSHDVTDRQFQNSSTGRQSVQPRENKNESDKEVQNPSEHHDPDGLVERTGVENR